MSDDRPREARERIDALDEKVEEIRKRHGEGTKSALYRAVIAKFPAAGMREREFRRQVTDEGKLNATYQRYLCEFAGLDWEAKQDVLHGTLEELRAELDRLQDAAELVQDDRFVDPAKKSSDLALLDLFVPTNAPPAGPGAVQVSFILNCPQPTRGDGWCVKAGWLEFDLGTGLTTHVRDRRGFGGGMTINNAKLMIHDPDRHKPSWHVQAVTGEWIGMVADVPADFLLAGGLTPPHEIRAQFRVCVANIGVSFPMPAGKTEKAAKTKLKQRLAQMKAVVDDDGKAVLAAISIKVKVKPQP